MKIKAVDIQMGDRIVAYCNNRMQICRVKWIPAPDFNTITLIVSTSEKTRNAVSRVIRFQRDASVELYARCSSSDEPTLEVEN